MLPKSEAWTNVRLTNGTGIEEEGERMIEDRRSKRRSSAGSPSKITLLERVMAVLQHVHNRGVFTWSFLWWHGNHHAKVGRSKGEVQQQSPVVELEKSSSGLWKIGLKGKVKTIVRAFLMAFQSPYLLSNHCGHWLGPAPCVGEVLILCVQLAKWLLPGWFEVDGVDKDGSSVFGNAAWNSISWNKNNIFFFSLQCFNKLSNEYFSHIT